MFDSVGAFTKQFTPVEGGYLFYPSRKGGGKLVTSEEYETLVADWQRVAGTAGVAKTVGVIFSIILLWVLVSQAVPLPNWTDNLPAAAVVIAISARLLWASFAPRRLVKDRPTMAPPQPVSERRRKARAALNWPMIIFALLFSGATFFATITQREHTLATWAWLVGSGLILATYIWIGFQKLSDGRS